MFRCSFQSTTVEIISCLRQLVPHNLKFFKVVSKWFSEFNFEFGFRIFAAESHRNSFYSLYIWLLFADFKCAHIIWSRWNSIGGSFIIGMIFQMFTEVLFVAWTSNRRCWLERQIELEPVHSLILVRRLRDVRFLNEKGKLFTQLCLKNLCLTVGRGDQVPLLTKGFHVNVWGCVPV